MPASLHLYIGGTDGAANGTQVSEDGTQLHAITFTALSTSRKVHARCSDGYETASMTVTAPAGFDLSDDGSTWGGSVTLTSVGDTNVPLYVRCLNYVEPGAPTLARLSVEAADLTFLPVDYTFASTYFVNADITALVA